MTGDIPEELFSERSVNTTVAETEPGEYVCRACCLGYPWVQIPYT